MEKESPKERAHQSKGHSKTHILQSFLGKEGDRKGKWEELTWNQAFDRSGIPHTTFGRLFVELVEEGSLKGKVVVEKKKLVTRFFLPEPLKPDLDFRGSYGRKETYPQALTIGFCVEEDKAVHFVREGRMRKMRKGAKGENKEVFLPTTPFVEIKYTPVEVETLIKKELAKKVKDEELLKDLEEIRKKIKPQ